MKQKITSLDYAILGLINNSPKSGYSIRKEFETTALGNYSSSPGSIYPALKRLEKLELVEKKQNQTDAKMKFHCSEKGIESLTNWILMPLENQDIEKNISIVLLKFAFMENLVDKKEVLIFLNSFKMLLQTIINDLNSYQNTELESLPLHGKLAIQHGVNSYKSSLKWCTTSISEISNN